MERTVDKTELDKRKMSHFGVGPLYVISIIILTIAAVYIERLGYLSVGEIKLLKIPLFIIGIALILIGLVIWWQGAITSKINKNISQNELVTTGIYAWVRNPIYSAFAIAFTGIILLQNNLILFVVPFIYWILLKTMIKKEEYVLEKVFGERYLVYKSKVNCCIPWFPNRK